MTVFDQARLRATHNSYSGNEGGERGSIWKQLDKGIRCLEFDFRVDNYATLGDYQLGHLLPGHQVARGLKDTNGPGNPDTLALGDWLGVVEGWCRAHPTEGPIVLILDSKDDLTPGTPGDLADFNGLLTRVFGPMLYTREDWDAAAAWPDESALAGRVLAVLSGNGATRHTYRWAFGRAPALAANDAGTVVLASREASGALRCWTGTASAAGVTWHRVGTYSASTFTLSNPSIALSDDGWLIAVQELPPAGPSGTAPFLECRLGRVQGDWRIKWSPRTSTFGNGTSPTVAIDGDAVQVVFLHPDGTRRMQRTGVLNRRKPEVDWRAARVTQNALLARDSADWLGHNLRVLLDTHGAIVTTIDGGSPLPVRMPQVAFVERQTSEDTTAFLDPLFYGAPATDRVALTQARGAGLVTRGWGFAETNRAPAAPFENMPATDNPFEQWYQGYV